MAVPAGILIQIFLVILLSREEIPDWLDNNRKGLPHLCLLSFIDFSDSRKLSLVRVIYTGSILDSDIISLPVY